MVRTLKSVDEVTSENHKWEISTNEHEKYGLIQRIKDHIMVYAGSSMADFLQTPVEEAVNNGFYHGNLNVKKIFGHRKEVERRLADKNYSSRTLTAEIVRVNDLIVISVMDQGNGFNHGAALAKETRMSPGLGMIYKAMDDVFFNEEGTHITMLKYLYWTWERRLKSRIWPGI